MGVVLDKLFQQLQLTWIQIFLLILPVGKEQVGFVPMVEVIDDPDATSFA